MRSGYPTELSELSRWLSLPTSAETLLPSVPSNKPHPIDFVVRLSHRLAGRVVGS